MAKNPETIFEHLQYNKMHDTISALKNDPKNLRNKLFLIIGTIFLCSLCFSLHLTKGVTEERENNYQPGYSWPSQTVEAEFSFPVYKDDDDYKKEIEDAKSSALKVFFLDRNIQASVLMRIDTLSKRKIDSLKVFNDYTTNVFLDSSAKNKLSLIADLTEKIPYKIKLSVKNIIEDIYKRGFIDVQLDTIKQNEIAIRVSENTDIIEKKYKLVDSSIYKDIAKKNIAEQIPQEWQQSASELLRLLMFPNLHFSAELSKQSEDLAVKSVPATDGIVRKGEIIIEKGQKITDKSLKKLKSYYKSRFLKNEAGSSLIMFVGSLGHAALIILILIIYLFFIRKRIFYDNSQVAILCGILFLVSIFAWLSLEISSKLPVEYFILLPGLSMLAAIVFDSRTAFYVTITMALMISGIRGNDYDTGLVMLFSGTLAAYTVRDIQSRTQMFKSIFFIFIGFAVPIVSLGLEHSSDFMSIIYRLLSAVLNSAISPLFTFGLLFIIERITNITTDLRLEEYNNLNHPLLVKLSEIAPGTFQHTLALVSIAQKCAFSIGANDLFVTVGAYFHDIGKIVHPEYFIENQAGINNKLDLMPPKRSAEVIRNHVIEGVRLANEYKIPQRIIDFIPMHHGTSLIRFFYTKAIDESENREAVNEMDYRYPGPKPRTKEAAIIMICDSAEALSRATPKEKDLLQKAVERSVKEKINDGQFDECNLTMNEIHIIIDTCVRFLIGIGHQRIAYKDLPEKDAEGD
jgi:cyclic-di-AMP phosphodiesterase PgpH